MESLRKLLDAECEYRMRRETIDKFIGLMTEVELKRHQILLPYNTLDDNVYIVKKGLIRTLYWDGFMEKTFAFAPPGTLKIPWYPFVKGAPAYSKYVACCDSVVMKVPKAEFTDLLEQSHDFALWVLSVFLQQFYLYEMKREVMNGDARERFEALILTRPEIINNVSSGIIASYIGVTPQYLCKLKKDFSHKLKK